MKPNAFVGIAGNIGVGKTTFTEKIAERFGWEAYYESVVDNPYLSDFYHDMHRWSFNLQIYFLHHRFETHIHMSKIPTGSIQDRTIYEDVEIFARNLHEMRFMSQRDWDTYDNLFRNMTSFLRKPDLIIYLKATTDTLLSRIKNRSRDYEQTIDPEYLHSLNISYDKWVKRIDDIPVYVIPTDRFNIFTDKEKFEDICTEIQNRLS
ncbi:MAG: deoxynucleoside kinase [Candidatus Marinimicrobia bacterium]|nr:deoxynucleoside kinase [Candidatus Neomarinimicrobiota bacterium]